MLIGPYESQDKMKIQEDWYDVGVPKGFGKELYESDLDRLDKCIEHVMDLLPIIQETDIQVISFLARTITGHKPVVLCKPQDLFA